MQFLLYGANGYTGKLITDLATSYGLSPILAGRNAKKISKMAADTGFEYRVFDLKNKNEIDKGLRGVKVVLHCAGPFKFTSKPMAEACLRNGVHYLDITGEMEMMEAMFKKNEVAKKAGIMLMSGCGFDVVPTDCLAVYLKNKMPDATHLKLAFHSYKGGVSHGTATTMAENLGMGGAVRKNGKIKPVPLGHKSFKLDFNDKKILMMAIPWGDVSTAFHSTGIPNIETYTSVHPKQLRFLKYQKWFNWLLRTDFVKNRLKKKIDRRSAGPSDEVRKKAQMWVWGEVKNQEGETQSARLITPEGYTLTAHTALNITKKVLEGNFETGFQTPAMLYGADLIFEVEGTQRF